MIARNIKLALPLGKKIELFPIKRFAKKPPLIDDNLNAASSYPAILKTWAAKWPGCNWGIALKKSRLIVVDVDRKPGKHGQETFDLLEMHYGFPATFTVLTPSGGLHLYYSETNIVRHQYAQGVHGFGIDVDSTNYVIAPGCVLQGDDGYGDYTPKNDLPIALAPDWFALFLKPRVQSATDQSIPVVELDKEMHINWAIDYLLHHAPWSIEREGGEKALFDVAAVLKDHGISEHMAVELINRHYNDPNFGRCIPPWTVGTGPTEDRLDVKVHNAFIYADETAPGSATAEADFADCIEELTPADIENNSKYANNGRIVSRQRLRGVDAHGRRNTGRTVLVDGVRVPVYQRVRG